MSKIKISKNKIKFAIILFVILLVIIGIVFIYFQGYSKNKVMARVISGLDNLNYSYTSTDNSTVKIVGKKERQEYSDGNIIYIDYNNKTSVKANASLNYKEEYNNNGIVDMGYYKEIISQYFDNKNLQYSYKGQKNYKGKDYTVVEFKYIYNTGDVKNYIDLFINNQTNLVDRLETYSHSKNSKRELTNEIDYNYSNGNNLESDVTVPKEVLTNYSSDTNN